MSIDFLVILKPFRVANWGHLSYLEPSKPVNLAFSDSFQMYKFPRKSAFGAKRALSSAHSRLTRDTLIAKHGFRGLLWVQILADRVIFGRSQLGESC